MVRPDGFKVGAISGRRGPAEKMAEQEAPVPKNLCNSKRLIRSPRRRWPGEQADFEAKRLGGLEIEHQFILVRGLHWEVSRFLAFEDAIDVAGGAARASQKRGTGHLPVCWCHVRLIKEY